MLNTYDMAKFLRNIYNLNYKMIQMVFHFMVVEETIFQFKYGWHIYVVSGDEIYYNTIGITTLEYLAFSLTIIFLFRMSIVIHAIYKVWQLTGKDGRL